MEAEASDPSPYINNPAQQMWKPVILATKNNMQLNISGPRGSTK